MDDESPLNRRTSAGLDVDEVGIESSVRVPGHSLDVALLHRRHELPLRVLDVHMNHRQID